MKLSTVICSCLIVPMLASVVVAQGGSGDVAAGKSLFKKANCVVCHGPRGDGKGLAAMVFDPPPANLTDGSTMAHLSDGDIVRHIREGVPGTSMPAWGKRLSETQVLQIVTYIRTLAR